MPVYGEDPTPTLAPIASIEEDGYADHLLTTGMHTGTHIDAPAHMIPNSKKISDYPPETFFGRGKILDARGVKNIGASLLNNIMLDAGDILLIYTGWSEKFSNPAYFTDYPELTEEFAKRIVQSGICMLGLDSPSPDQPPYPIHKILLSKEILIIENLTNLNQLIGKPFEVCASPLNIRADAAPARVIAHLTQMDFCPTLRPTDT